MIIVEQINSDLKEDGKLLVLLIEKPSDYKSFAKKWDIDLDVADTFELFLTNKINDYIPKRAYIEGIFSGLERLKIPTDTPLRLTVFKERLSTYFLLQVIPYLVEIDTFEGELPF
jgi:hypothetical protein